MTDAEIAPRRAQATHRPKARLARGPRNNDGAIVKVTPDAQLKNTDPNETYDAPGSPPAPAQFVLFRRAQEARAMVRPQGMNITQSINQLSLMSRPRTQP